jgi:ribosomal protein S18 acetylase RimI-like enzyme
VPVCHDRQVSPPIEISALHGPPDPVLVDALTVLLGDLVTSGAALGWVERPSYEAIDGLLRTLTDESENGDASTRLAHEGQRLIAFGCWRRYRRPTHRPHADLPYLAVSSGHQGRGLGQQVLDQLIKDARAAHLEQLTLDSRGDNAPAHALWRSRGFVEYGRLPAFVAVGEARYDKTFWVLDLRAS